MIPVIPNLGFRFVEQAKAKKKEKPVCVCFWNTELSALISKDPETTTHFNNLPKTMPNWSNGEKLSTLHELSNLENHLKKMFSV